MKNITVAKIRKAIADDKAAANATLGQNYVGEPHDARDDWLQISRMSDDEIQRSIDAGFSWPRRMFDPCDPENPLDLSDLDDEDDAAALLRSQPA